MPAASNYAVTYSASDTSSSQVAAHIDTLTVAQQATLVGDANHDGIVNGQDIALISSDWLHAGANLSTDVNHDGVVNGQDIALTSSNWLQTSGAAQTSAVPEPSTVVLLCLGLLAMLTWRKRLANV